MTTKNEIDRRSAVTATPLGRWLVLALAALLCFGAAMQAHAQAQGGDPPDRVARLSDVSGQVWLYSPDANEWVAVARNRPLTTGDRIATDNGARAEVSLGTTVVRLDSATELEVAQLDDSTYRLHLYGGSVTARLRSPSSLAEFALETDEGQFRVQTVGRYRFDHFDQASDLTVYTGQAVFEGRNSALPLTTGQHAQFWLDANGAAQYNMVEPVRDAFAAWNDDRDRATDRPVAASRYVSPEMTGADDLDRYGQWEQTPDYGAIWTPRSVAADWAPYSAGHWAWVPPWGWTWVDDAPWGFAPFHYGRWVHYRNRWCWAPGTYVARPVYAPALVAWIGGPRVNVGISIGGGGPPVGWFPLAPHEVYVPSYRTSPRYVREVNITHVTNVTNITNIVNNVNGAADRRDFANRKFPNAVTVVPATVLTNRQPVAPVAAQWRANPQVRALVADARPAPVMSAAPVATPPKVARPVAGPAPRPPIAGPAPGVLAGRPGGGEARAGRLEPRPGERPNAVPSAAGVAPPVAGVAPPNRPGAPIAPVSPRPGAPAVAGQAARPPVVAAPPGGRVEPVRPVQGATPPAAAIERPPIRGGVAREPGEAPRAVVPPSPVQRPTPPVEAVRPAIAPRPEAPVVRNAEIPRPPPRSEATRAPEVHRAVEAPRAVAPPPPRPVEAVRPAEAPRVVAPARPEPPRAVEAPRAQEAARPGPPEAHVAKPEAPRREEKRDEKRDPNDKQQQK